MSEKPILFSGPMVRAILDGKKRMTRRIVKGVPDGAELYPVKEVVTGEMFALQIGDDTHHNSFRCPFIVGQTLWVRESFCELDKDHWFEQSQPKDALLNFGRPRRNACAYAADTTDADANRCRIELGDKWKPSIHMPRWASRLTLRVTEARVERLQDITTEDITSEGVDNGKSNTAMGARHDAMQQLAWIELWDSINSGRGYAWDRNPWVWVIGFERVEATK